MSAIMSGKSSGGQDHIPPFDVAAIRFYLYVNCPFFCEMGKRSNTPAMEKRGMFPSMPRSY